MPDHSHSAADLKVVLLHLLSYEIQKVMLSDSTSPTGRSLRGPAPAEKDQNSTLSRLLETFSGPIVVS